MLDGLTSGHASEAIDYWCGWSDKVTVQYREALLRLERMNKPLPYPGYGFFD